VRHAIDNGSPVIALVDNGSHWVVVYGYDDRGGFWCADSSGLKLRWGPRQFQKRWDREGLVVRG
jgi:ABC-type bacteriocin/lantibiotic exporter with double-glycine peptidase domain